jgi:hypothetical protein
MVVNLYLYLDLMEYEINNNNNNSWRPFLYLRPEDESCCGDRNPLNMGKDIYIRNFRFDNRFVLY